VNTTEEKTFLLTDRPSERYADQPVIGRKEMPMVRPVIDQKD
jgi:hypothetical protein